MLAHAAVATLVAHALIQAAGAQGGGGMDGDGVAAELRQIRVQMEEANRRSEALFWESIAVGAAIAITVAACSVWYLRKQANLLASDMRERLRPALTRTKCYMVVGDETGVEAGAKRVVFEVTNVGQVAAVEVDGHARFGVGDGINMPGRVKAFGLSLGAVVPNSPHTISMNMRSDWNPPHDVEPFRFEIVLDYKAIGGRSFWYVASGALHNGYIEVQETTDGGQARITHIDVASPV